MIRGDRLKTLMEAAGLSQSELARRLGLTQPTIAKFISGGRGSSHTHRIARELGTTAEYLTGEIDDPSPDAPPPEPRSVEPTTIMLPVVMPPEQALSDMIYAMMLSMPDMVTPLSEERQAALSRELAKLLPIVLARVKGPFRSDRTGRDDGADDAAEGHDGARPARRQA